MTTEILRSMLYRGADLIRDIEWVIFDEASRCGRRQSFRPRDRPNRPSRLIHPVDHGILVYDRYCMIPAERWGCDRYGLSGRA